MEEKEKQELLKKAKEETEKAIKKVVDQGIQLNNIDFLYKAIDIHKDLANEEYWKTKEEKNMYREYDNYSDSYGRRGVPGTGRRRYRESGNGNYGRRYRGEEILGEMMDNYSNYSEGKEMYGADQETMKSFKYMLKSFKDYYKHLKEEANSPEEIKLLEQTAREMLEM